MRFHSAFLEEITNRLAQFGLSECPVCSGTMLTASPFPHLIPFGGLSDTGSGTTDPDANVIFAVRIECRTCGYLLFINSEQHRSGDEPMLWSGQGDEPAMP